MCPCQSYKKSGLLLIKYFFQKVVENYAGELILMDLKQLTTESYQIDTYLVDEYFCGS